MSLKIGNITLKNNLILAPMAGVTDLPYRLICKEMGCGLVYSEMVSAKAILYNNKNTIPLLAVDKREKPISLQMFGSDPEIMSEMAKRIEELDFDILDINMGCPVPKIVNNGEGSALMKEPKLVGEIVSKVSKAINKPVTIKIRKGFDDTCINAVEIAKIAEESGAKAVAVHGRTRVQYYSGKADWNIIREVKKNVSIPVIGNGDIFQPEDVIKMLEITECDGIMIGRGIQGNPWLFSQIIEYMNKRIILSKPDIAEVVNLIKRHARMQIEFKGEYLGMREMRKHVAWYTSGYKNSSKLRQNVNQIETTMDLDILLDSYLENYLSDVETF